MKEEEFNKIVDIEPEVLAGIRKYEFEFEVEPLKEVFKLINTHIDEAMIRITEKGWHIKLVDPAYVLMADIKIDATLFKKYNLEENLKIGVDTGAIWEFLRICSEFTKKWIRGFVITTSKATKHDLELIVNGNLIRHFRGVDIDGIQDPKIPGITHHVTTTVKTEDLKFAMEQSNQITDHYNFIAEDQSLKLKVYGEGPDDWVRFLLKNHIDCEELPFRAMFASDYMGGIVQNITSEEIEISLRGDYPVILKYSIADIIPIKIIHAPRIDTE